MKRRPFTILSAVSLLICMATITLWIRSGGSGRLDVTRISSFIAVPDDGILSVFRTVPGGVAQIDFYYWKWTALLATAPILRLALAWWDWDAASGPDSPACGRCGYNLTGNTSGICPECGTNAADPLQ
jgi:hypothetical protein